MWGVKIKRLEFLMRLKKIYGRNEEEEQGEQEIVFRV